MRCFCLRGALVLTAALTLWSAMAAPCAAGPIIDWLLFGRRAAYYPPATAYYPNTGYYQTTAGYANACQTGCNPCQTAQHVVSYVPQTTFRTVANYVPVTLYRPVTGVDPGTCCPTTTLQPCTTYQVQVQRVPTTCYRPVYSTVTSSWLGANVAAVAQPTGLPVATGGCASCAAPGADPYGASAPLSYSAQPGSYGSSMGGSVVTQPTTAADMAPSLDPGSTQLNYPSNSNSYPYSNYPQSSYPPSSLGDPPPTAPVGSGVRTQPLNSGASLNSAPLNSGSNSRAWPATQMPRNERDPSASLQLRPIPNPGPNSGGSPMNMDRVPQLLGPREKTASARAWQVKTIQWKSNDPAAGIHHRTSSLELVDERESNPPVDPPVRQAPRKAKKKYNDSGWESARGY